MQTSTRFDSSGVCFLMLRQFAILIVFAGAFFASFAALAADEVVNFDNPEHKQMYQSLLKEYRCLKCQNQNLWDSNASLAGDLRREIRGQILAGNSKPDIDDYLVSRYGEFVLYNPRFSAKTAILWLGPFVLLFIGLGSVLLMVRSKSATKLHAGSAPEDNNARLDTQENLSRARDLLKN